MHFIFIFLPDFSTGRKFSNLQARDAERAAAAVVRALDADWRRREEEAKLAARARQRERELDHRVLEDAWVALLPLERQVIVLRQRADVLSARLVGCFRHERRIPRLGDGVLLRKVHRRRQIGAAVVRIGEKAQFRAQVRILQRMMLEPLARFQLAPDDESMCVRAMLAISREFDRMPLPPSESDVAWSFRAMANGHRSPSRSPTPPPSRGRYRRRADLPLMSRGDAAAATRIVLR